MPKVGNMPNVAIPRSRFKQEFDHATSWLHGNLIPIDCFEVLPGDDISVHRAAAEIHMSTPIVPIMGNIKQKVVAFFVPMRLIWEHTEEFYGANKTSAGPQTNTYSIPHNSLFLHGCTENSVSHYLGKPVTTQDNTKTSFGLVSVLKERGYWFIANEWFRNQQLQNPIIVNTGDPGYIGTLNGNQIYLSSDPWVVNKQLDYFTQATLYPQYGAAVALPLGTYAPLTTEPNDFYSIDAPSFSVSTDSQASLLGIRSSSWSNGAHAMVAQGGSINNFPQTSYDVDQTNIWVDLRNATAAKINDIRYAFQLQKYLERANYGSRFFEVLAVHYGVTSPDARLQRPEYLGGKTAPIIVRTVLSTAGYDASTSQKVGAPGASSITTIDLSGLFSKGFVEPGYVYVLAYNNHERLYSQGIMREDYKFDRFEFYSPEFANLGDQEIRKKELFVTGSAADEDVFGYIGHWDEYRYRKKIVSGKLDPAVNAGLAIWTLADKYNAAPSLGASWIVENRDSISRCLVSGATGPDYIGDWYIEYATTRELPLYNIPGLVDHFGVM